MKHVTAKVISNIHILPESRYAGHRISREARLIWLNCPDISGKATPGQFVMMNCGGGCTLPRPFSIFRTFGSDLAILYSVWEDGRGTEWLAARHTGDMVQLFGPLGNGFSLKQDARNILLIAGGMGIAPLNYLAQEASYKLHTVTLLYGTATRSRYPIPPEIRQVSATEDGSLGYHGMITDLIPQNVEKADQVFACGPISMYKDMAHRKTELNLDKKPVQISLEVRMGCGNGVCFSCTVRTKNGPKQVCKDGPVFNMDDIVWDSITI